MPAASDDARPLAGLVHLMGDFDTVPFLQSVAALLLRRGYRLDVVYVHDPAYAPPRFADAPVRLVPVTRLPRKRWPAWLRRVAEGPLWLLQALWRCRGRRYACLFGVDPVGLVVAGLLAAASRSPLVYISLELYLSHEARNPALRLLKAAERFVNRRALYTIVQDQKRADLLAAENGIERSRIALAPNAPLGPARRERTDFLQRRLGLEPGQVVILHAGTLALWTDTPALVQAAQAWPQEWTLVLHSRQRTAEIELDLRQAGPRVRLSDQPVPYADLPRLLSSADIGLVLYRNLDTVWHGDNMTYVGLSSGKLAEYLRCGLPVVVSRWPGLADLVDEYQCGVCVDNAGEIRAAVASILADYERFSQGSIRCFEEVFDMERRFEPVLAALAPPAPLRYG